MFKARDLTPTHMIQKIRLNIVCGQFKLIFLKVMYNLICINVYNKIQHTKHAPLMLDQDLHLQNILAAKCLNK